MSVKVEISHVGTEAVDAYAPVASDRLKAADIFSPARPGQMRPGSRTTADSPARLGLGKAQAGPVMLKPGRTGLLRTLILLTQGFSPTFFSLVILVMCLRAFPQLQPPSKWEQRLFNTLSILLTAIASFGLGLLLGNLDSMLRWPLLSRKVDSILVMSPPATLLRLIWRHIQEGYREPPFLSLHTSSEV
ncbi:hypothetical protein HOY82DRAFT_597192 [Tuber indicum]|nr:hypothetical protein HOY82DRAFT_597192 [Tuber indicum]